uniref:Uncharacterized protein n=1 Tax=Lepeophtheirus salmonis TaxID=72036 RepID=A0A0K2VEV6_LEPSM
MQQHFRSSAKTHIYYCYLSHIAIYLTFKASFFLITFLKYNFDSEPRFVIIYNLQKQYNYLNNG